MRNIKPKTKYSGISLPEEFMDSIKRFVLSETDYKSIAEFVKDAVREKMYRDKKNHSYFGWRIVPNPNYPFQSIAREKDHTIDMEEDIMELKRQMKEILELLKNKKNKEESNDFRG